MTRTFAESIPVFWGRVEVLGLAACWEWQAGKQAFGYGSFIAGGRKYASHVFAYLSVVGSIPNGLHILHRCDNPSCCNPYHLRLGTHAENMRDKERKGRGNQPKGEDNAFARLTEADVLEIRRKHATGIWGYAHLGRMYGVSAVTASLIVRKRKWKHLP